MTTPYDTVHYPGRWYDETHPDRLATIAAFYGMEPAPAAQCRVLELGCGFGGNLVPMAYQYPDSRFVGIDLSQRSIERGAGMVAALGLKNIELRHCDIMDVTAEFGRFDYIISHGVYSWVPDTVREKMLAIFAAHLSPQGVAYVSYNAHPASHLRDLARDMMLFHVRDIVDPKKRVEQARAILRFLSDASPKDSVHGTVMRGEWARIQGMGDEVLFHDDLDEASKPFLLHQVVADANRHALQYLSEATLWRRDLQSYSEEIQNVLARFPDSAFMERDQYQDFVEGHGFRRTLLCHDNVRLNRAVDARCIKRFHLAAEFKKSEEPAPTSGHALSTAAIIHLGQSWPAAVGFADLLENASRQVASSGEGAREITEEDVARLTDVLFRAVCSGHIELHLQPPRLTTAISPRPEASFLARKQAETERVLTNLRHRTVILEDEIARQFLKLVDGTRDVDQLAADLGARLQQAGLASKAQVVTRAQVEHHLGILARRALLIA